MQEKVLDILANICEDDIVKEDMNVDLFETGLLDSLAFIEMMVQMEEEFNIAIAPSELDRAQVNTPQKLIEMIEKRIG